MTTLLEMGELRSDEKAFPLEAFLNVKGKPELAWIEQGAPVRKALDKMIPNKFSQLPIIDDSGDLTGLVTERGILRNYHAGVHNLYELPVEQCQSEFTRLNLHANAFVAMRTLDDDAAIVIVEGNKPKGIVTDWDTTQFLLFLSEGILVVGQIERKLDKIKKDFLNAYNYTNNKPSTGKKVKLMLTHWDEFDGLYDPRELFERLMRKVEIIRHDFAHFLDNYGQEEIRVLKIALGWLRYGEPISEAHIQEIESTIAASKVAAIRSQRKSRSEVANVI